MWGTPGSMFAGPAGGTATTCMPPISENNPRHRHARWAESMRPLAGLISHCFATFGAGSACNRRSQRNKAAELLGYAPTGCPRSVVGLGRGGGFAGSTPVSSEGTATWRAFRHSRGLTAAGACCRPTSPACLLRCTQGTAQARIAVFVVTLHACLLSPCVALTCSAASFTTHPLGSPRPLGLLLALLPARPSCSLQADVS